MELKWESCKCQLLLPDLNPNELTEKKVRKVQVKVEKSVCVHQRRYTQASGELQGEEGVINWAKLRVSKWKSLVRCLTSARGSGYLE